MKIYTKTGDKGKTSLYDSNRVDKDSVRVEAYGTVDELNSYLGFARSFCEDDDIKSILFDIQRKLFDVAGELATMDAHKFPERIDEDQIKNLEKIIDNYLLKMNKNEAFKFIIPGSNKSSASLHVARTICRRAERRILTLSKTEEISALLIKYINRLSDVIYTLARFLETKLDYVEFKK
ncbi:MAG: cob(I)yrinic acid a,c-diamide adenosyltransferase [Peptostreptococcaceae bacterium]|jgi:cob(I)alamin adenosyltransferase|nr:cob(I)yrinic acid a,c-diamide adenosyltransferase [Peptostreptococcaceae bacterium]